MGYLFRAYPQESVLEGMEVEEFKQMLRDRPELKKSYRDFKDTEYQRVRARVGRSPWLDESLDKLFELAAVSGL